ncbi:MAG: UvrD-helicase domain-containing protein [Endomicrobium sp.]|nr:UvrD-helicase domain-containing protein [Endomicrobium sp.]
MIFAGAGTSKTKVIVHRMAYLISQGVMLSATLS